MNTRPIGASFAALAAIIAALLFARDLSTTYAFLAPGTTFTVNSTGDLPDADPEDGLCQTANGNGECTLRAALEQANALAHPDKERIPSPSISPARDSTLSARGRRFPRSSVRSRSTATRNPAVRLTVIRLISQTMPIYGSSWMARRQGPMQTG